METTLTLRDRLICAGAERLADVLIEIAKGDKALSGRVEVVAAESREDEGWVERLRAIAADDNYGVRGALPLNAASLLSEEQLRRLARQYEKDAARTEPDTATGLPLAARRRWKETFAGRLNFAGGSLSRCPITGPIPACWTCCPNPTMKPHGEGRGPWL